MLVMECFDGRISPEKSLILKAHLDLCGDCREFASGLEKMKAVMPVYEPPKGLSEKIMNAVINYDIRESKHKSFRRIFALSGITTAVFALTLLIATNTGHQKDTVIIADMPVKKQNITCKTPDEAKVIAVVNKEPVPVVSEEKAENFINSPVPLFEAETASDTEKGPGLRRVVNIASSGQKHEMPVTAAERAGQAGVVAAAKVTPIVPPQNRLLDIEKAIVGNNVINLSTGGRAIIRVKVDEPSPVRVIVYDNRIKPVRVIVDEQKEIGVYEAFWDARNDAGQTVTQGVYHVYIQIGKAVIKRSVVVTR